jgi:hypothetical protein
MYLEEWISVVVNGDNECTEQMEDWVIDTQYVFVELTAWQSGRMLCALQKPSNGGECGYLSIWLQDLFHPAIFWEIWVKDLYFKTVSTLGWACLGCFKFAL